MIRRLALLLVVVLAAAAGLIFLLRDEGPSYSPLDLEDDPFAYEPDREDEFERRAAAGHSHVVYVKSPGGIVATAQRMRRWRDGIEDAAAAAGIDPDLIEGMVLLESAGRPDARASDDLEGAVGLTQILAETATSLLGLEVDVERSERLIRRLGRARGPGQAERIRERLADVDERFDPGKALAATGRYLKIAMDEFGREDLAVVSYHMGIGNLQTLLRAYGDDEASYAQLFFDTAPDSHPRAHRILTGLGDDSKTYLWRVLASAEIMRLFREDRARLERLDRLHTAATSGELVLHPPGEEPPATHPIPGDLGAYGLRARRPELELAPGAFGIASYIGQGARKISGARRALVLTRANGWRFEIRRDYASGRQAEAFQYMLDRLQALNLIAWVRDPNVIRITASREGEELAQ